jgi:[protein-PII] uridylyltransferase
MRRIAIAARSIAWRSDESWRGTDAELKRSFSLRGPKTEEVGAGIVAQGEEIELADTADLADPVLALRVAAAAARRGASISLDALAKLAEVPPLAIPWPDAAREAFVDLLLAGRGAIMVIEALDHEGLWERFLPEWECVHSKPQRNAYHRFTVDRHLLEAAANASALTDRVDRPDLLVTGALLHDIGKGRPGDHTEVGIVMIDEIATRMGFPPSDVHDLVQMVRHHLLLPDIATRRDLSDDGTVSFVAEQVETSRVLHLLDALTEADSLATGLAAWGDWKAGLVRQLVDRTAHVLDGGETMWLEIRSKDGELRVVDLSALVASQVTPSANAED